MSMNTETSFLKIKMKNMQNFFVQLKESAKDTFFLFKQIIISYLIINIFYKINKGK